MKAFINRAIVHSSLKAQQHATRFGKVFVRLMTVYQTSWVKWTFSIHRDIHIEQTTYLDYPITLLVTGLCSSGRLGWWCRFRFRYRFGWFCALHRLSRLALSFPILPCRGIVRFGLGFSFVLEVIRRELARLSPSQQEVQLRIEVVSNGK